MSEPPWPKEAEEFFRKGYEAQMAGALDAAIAHYKQSLEIYPTAEAHTFLGWTYSFQGRYDDAIRECEVAITVDPDFGNPYNDVLVKQGKTHEAIREIKRALEIEPGYTLAYRELHRLLGQLN